MMSKPSLRDLLVVRLRIFTSSCRFEIEAVARSSPLAQVTVKATRAVRGAFSPASGRSVSGLRNLEKAHVAMERPGSPPVVRRRHAPRTHNGGAKSTRDFLHGQQQSLSPPGHDTCSTLGILTPRSPTSALSGAKESPDGRGALHARVDLRGYLRSAGGIRRRVRTFSYVRISERRFL